MRYKAMGHSIMVEEGMTGAAVAAAQGPRDAERIVQELNDLLARTTDGRKEEMRLHAIRYALEFEQRDHGTIDDVLDTANKIFRFLAFGDFLTANQAASVTGGPADRRVPRYVPEDYGQAKAEGKFF